MVLFLVLILFSSVMEDNIFEDMFDYLSLSKVVKGIMKILQEGDWLK